MYKKCAFVSYLFFNGSVLERPEQNFDNIFPCCKSQQILAGKAKLGNELGDFC